MTQPGSGVILEEHEGAARRKNAGAPEVNGRSAGYRPVPMRPEFVALHTIL